MWAREWGTNDIFDPIAAEDRNRVRLATMTLVEVSNPITDPLISSSRKRKAMIDESDYDGGSKGKRKDVLGDVAESSGSGKVTSPLRGGP